MNKEQLKKWLPEITHWINGGDLYVYDPIDDTWNVKVGQTFRIDQIYVIKDRHFKLRKAYALGEEIEQTWDVGDGWQTVSSPVWDQKARYRTKPKKPVYDYQFTYRVGDKWLMSMGRWQGIKEAMHFIVGSDIAKFEPSKKEKE